MRLATCTLQTSGSRAASLETGNWRNSRNLESIPQVHVATITRIPQVLTGRRMPSFGFPMEMLSPMDPCIAGDKDRVDQMPREDPRAGRRHNDFPRSNVMRNRDGRLVVIDSGLVEKRSPYIVSRRRSRIVCIPSRLILFPFKGQVLLSVPNSDMELLLRKREVSSGPLLHNRETVGL